MTDAALLLAWRNDPATRASSHSAASITDDTHASWLAQSLADPNRRLMIAMLDGRPAGTVRADLGQGVWELSWTVAPSHRGQGIGPRMVRLLAESIAEPIRAEVKVGNVASIRIAEAAGMLLVREANGVLHYGRTAGTR